MSTLTDVKAGDVLVVYDSTFPGWMIRLGATIERKPNKWNHILIMSHQDAAGTWWAIEAHPGHVGWTAGPDLHRYLTSGKTLNNSAQPKTDDQRHEIVSVARSLFGTPYDDLGITADVMEAIGWSRWDTGFQNGIPAHFVCSSLASYVYNAVGLIYPFHVIRTTTPADWAGFILEREWIYAPSDN